MGRLIDRVLLTPQKIIPVSGGNVLQALRADGEGFAGFGEAYFSLLMPGATKAWKRHRRMTLNLVVPLGRVAVAVIDEEARRGRIYELGPESYARLTVPPGLWAGFRGLARETSLMLNVANIGHDPDEADRAVETEFGFSWAARPFPSGPDQELRQ